MKSRTTLNINEFVLSVPLQEGRKIQFEYGVVAYVCKALGTSVTSEKRLLLHAH